MSACLILSTASSKKEARKIANLLLDLHLAACVSLISNAESIFRWKGKKQTACEWILLIKTERKFYSRIEKTIQKHHSYEVPEVIALSIAQGSRKYLKWLGDSLI